MMMQKKQEDTDQKIKLRLKDFFLTGESFYLTVNQRFGYLETHPQPKEELSKYYESPAYISHTDNSQSNLEKLYQWVKKRNIRYKFSLLKTGASSKSILDYGCGVGDFLDFAKNRGCDVHGIEPSAIALEKARAKLGNDSITSNTSLDELDKTYDYITLWHVLEHIPNLQEIIPLLKSHLKDGGSLFIAVPNHQSVDAKYYKQFWAGYDVPRHLWHFSPISIRALFGHFDMRVEKTHPLWVDSFYVSLLSEKYKKNRWGFISAPIVGAISNLVAIFNGSFSSLVYEIKKN